MSVASKEGSRKQPSPSLCFIDDFVARCAPGRLTSLLLGQLDAFNRIGTTFGQDQATAFCAQYAEQLRLSFPSGTPIIRLSERRFAVLLALESMSSVLDAAASITEQNQPQMQMGDDTFLVDVTLGVAVYPTHAEDAPSLFRRAELALQNAKDKELPFDIYRPDATRQQTALWKLESDLDRAIHQGDLEVHYQPKLGIADREMKGVEALIRWRTAGGNFVPPEDFIPLAERTGAIDALSWLVFDRVREAAEHWGRFDSPFSVAINVAPQVLEHSEFYARLKRLRNALSEYNVGLVVELTEDSLLQGDDHTLSNLERLREIGVGLAIDDFGKGYSSLTYLKRLPATEIKIDKQFIGTICHDETDRQIVKAVIDLAHALDMSVVAEGVDSEENLSVVAELGCEMAQGFLIARPMRCELVRDWMATYSAGGSLRGPRPVELYQVSAEV